MIALSRKKPWENGSDLNCGLWENRAHAANSWENDLNFFPLSGFPRTVVQNLNLLLLERGTGLEPATSTLGNSSKRPLLSAQVEALSSIPAHAFG
jgi:hypothetical protein